MTCLAIPHAQDRGNTPLHVAAQAGQAMQVELLVANGAHPSTLDKLGHTPEECARYVHVYVALYPGLPMFFNVSRFFV